MICLAIWSQTHRTVRALQVEQYSYRPGARVVGFGDGGQKKLLGDAYAVGGRLRIWNASAIR